MKFWVQRRAPFLNPPVRALDNLLAILQLPLLAFLPLAMAYAVFCDFRTLHIPNWISVALALAFLPAALIGGIGLSTIAAHYGTAFLIFIAAAIFFVRGFLGGGDVKLLTAAVVWFGWDELAVYLLVTALIGGALALIVLFLRNFPAAPFLGSLPGLQNCLAGGKEIPYGVAIGLAAIILFPYLDLVSTGRAAAVALF